VIQSIRANRIFSLLKQTGPERIAHVRFPLRRDPLVADYSLKLIETYVLLALAKITDAKRIFEFGTFLGSTTLNLALNTDAQVITLDLDHESAQQAASPRPEDHPAIDFRLNHYEMEWEPFPIVKDRIYALHGDSTKRDLSMFSETIELVWVDGGRDRHTVESDAGNAFRMLNPKHLSAIGWHDYLHPDCGELNQFLERLSNRVPLFHVIDTAMVIFFNQPVTL
jgi:Methyltransferase domain